MLQGKIDEILQVDAFFSEVERERVRDTERGRKKGVSYIFPNYIVLLKIVNLYLYT